MPGWTFAVVPNEPIFAYFALSSENGGPICSGTWVTVGCSDRLCKTTYGHIKIARKEYVLKIVNSTPLCQFALTKSGVLVLL